MKNIMKSIFLPALLLSVAVFAPAARAGISAEAVLDKVDDLYRGDSSRGKVTMRIRTEHWSRELTMNVWSKGENKSLIRILSPRKEKGTATLRDGNEIWNYLPKVNRVIKLPSSMMSDSWMGSHFTNNDLVKESRMADDYDYEITFNGKRGGESVVEVTCEPKPEAAVVWGKLLVTVAAGDFMPRSIEYYDEDMDLARTMTFSDVKELGGRRIPAVMKVTPADKPGEFTEVLYEEMEYNAGIEDEVFSLRNLRK